MGTEQLEKLMIRLAVRLDKVEAEMVELKAFISLTKLEKQQQKTGEELQQAMQDVKFNTLKEELHKL
jgi:hypothetical protein